MPIVAPNDSTVDSGLSDVVGGERDAKAWLEKTHDISSDLDIVDWSLEQDTGFGLLGSAGRMLAQLAGLGRGARLVGRWLGQLPDDTTLPWHRVLNSQGRLSLPADHPAGQEQARRLLDEGVIIRNRRVNMARYGWPDPIETRSR